MDHDFIALLLLYVGIQLADTNDIPHECSRIPVFYISVDL